MQDVQFLELEMHRSFRRRSVHLTLRRPI
jgi:hypothetical protein